MIPSISRSLKCMVVFHAQIRIYDDEDGARKEEIAALAQPDSGSFSTFYDRLKEIKDYYGRFPTDEVTEVRICMLATWPCELTWNLFAM